jgi:trehalose-6-phosphate synthase
VHCNNKLIFLTGIVNLSERLKLTSVRFNEIARFIEHHPQHRASLVFTIIGLAPEVKTDIYHRNVEEFTAWARLLNHRYGGEQVCFEQREEATMLPEQRMAYFAASTFMLLTVTP